MSHSSSTTADGIHSSAVMTPAKVCSNGDAPSTQNDDCRHHRYSRHASNTTFSRQATLPRLPIPTLEETLEKFPAAVSALLSSHDGEKNSNGESASNTRETKEMKECRKEIEQFLAVDGPPLQTLLLEYEQKGREDGTLGSYVEEFWTEAYLAPDQSVVLKLNPFFVLEDGPDTNKSKDQSCRAASLCFSAIKLASALKSERLVPDSFRGKALCMDQFRALFGACRVPELFEKDTVAVDPDSTHVVVLENNQMYFFQALWPDGTVAVNEQDIYEILTAIKADASKVAPEISSRNALGVLTTLPRREWANARDIIKNKSVHNKAALEIIDGALFVLVIDDVTPKDIHEAAANMLHGTYNLRSEENFIDYQAGSCCNRWYDKLQVIVCNDGRAGINFEHSAIDGHTALRFVSDIFADNIVSFAQSITKTIYPDEDIFPPLINADIRRATGANTHFTMPRKLNLELPQSILDKIYYAETALSDQIVSSDTVVLEFAEYGKTLIVRNRMSPDSFVQLSMLLAYYRLYGKIVCQYEPVLTKSFYHGRTEAMRTATEYAAAFCKTWCDPSATAIEKLNALRVATQHHSAGVKLASQGKGVDRHLFALKCIAEKNGIATPDFFSSNAYKKLNHTILSTSNCGNPSLRLFGFGPVVPDGFGIGYIIRDTGLQYSISSKHRQTKRYAHTLQQTLCDMGKLLEPLSAVTVACDMIEENRASTSSKQPIEFLEDYHDLFGESKASSYSNDESIEKSLSSYTPLSGSALARVLHRKSSFTAQKLRSFGETIQTPQDGGDKK